MHEPHHVTGDTSPEGPFCTREKKVVQWRPIRNAGQSLDPLAWKGCEEGTEDERVYAEGNADHGPDTAQHGAADSIIVTTNTVPKTPDHD
jgi:hypothetical protein